MEEKFDIEAIKQISKDVNYIFNEITTYDVRQTNPELIDAFEHMCRVANMFVMVKEQELEDGYVETADPQGYIQGKLSVSKGFTENYINSIKRESRS